MSLWFHFIAQKRRVVKTIKQYDDDDNLSEMEQQLKEMSDASAISGTKVKPIDLDLDVFYKVLEIRKSRYSYGDSPRYYLVLEDHRYVSYYL